MGCTLSVEAAHAIVSRGMTYRTRDGKHLWLSTVDNFLKNAIEKGWNAHRIEVKHLRALVERYHVGELNETEEEAAKLIFKAFEDQILFDAEIRNPQFDCFVSPIQKIGDHEDLWYSMMHVDDVFQERSVINAIERVLTDCGPAMERYVLPDIVEGYGYLLSAVYHHEKINSLLGRKPTFDLKIVESLLRQAIRTKWMLPR